MSDRNSRIEPWLGPIGPGPAILTLLAVTGVLLVLPVLTLLTPFDHTVLVWVVVAGYAASAVLLRRPLAGLCIGLTVASTSAFAVKHSSWSYLHGMPGWLGPTLWLVQIPLLVFAGVLLARLLRGEALQVSPVEAALGGFVIWTSLSTIYSGAPRPDTAFYFTLLVLHGWSLVLAVRRSVASGWIDFEEVVFALTAAVLGHAVFGAAQLLNQGVFGFRNLGEIARLASNPETVVMSLGPLPPFNVGLFVSGLTGNAYVLAALLVLVAPVIVATGIRVSGWRRLGALFALGLAAIVLRATNSDGARGAFVLGIAAFVAIAFYLGGHESLSEVRDRLPADRGHKGLRKLRGWNPTALGVVAVTGVWILFVAFSPTTRANSTSATVSLPRGTGAGDALSHLPLPSIDLGTLGSRLDQYAVAIDMFVDNPVFGIGGGNFRYIAARYGITEGTALHNIYLMLLAEIGLPGFLLYMTAIALVYRAGGRLLRDPGRNSRVTVLAALTGLTGYLAYAFWDHLALDRITAFLPFWVIAGALVGAYARERNPDTLVTDGLPFVSNTETVTAGSPDTDPPASDRGAIGAVCRTLLARIRKTGSSQSGDA